MREERESYCGCETTALTKEIQWAYENLHPMIPSLVGNGQRTYGGPSPFPLKIILIIKWSQEKIRFDILVAPIKWLSCPNHHNSIITLKCPPSHQSTILMSTYHVI